jgi:hypothetical protein
MWNVCNCKGSGVDSLGACAKCGGIKSVQYDYRTVHENGVMLNTSLVVIEIMIKDRINELKSKLKMQSQVKMSTTLDNYKIANLEIRIDELEKFLLKVKNK